MTEKIKKSLPWFLILIIFCLSAAILFNFDKKAGLEVKADVATTSVTVGNSAPSFVGNSYEEPVSDGTTPTNAGSNVTFKAQADDPNSETWYLVVCKSSQVATTTGGGCPSCPGGAWATSTATADNATATASYTAQDGDGQSNDWWAFACDSNSTSQKCSSANQGSGSSGSPFKVNHRPSFTAQANSGPVNPAATIYFYASSTDTDNDTATDTLYFTVCKTVGVSGTSCDGGAGDTWCTTTAASDPSCSATVADPAEGSQSYYPYIFDSHQFASNAGLQGSAQNYTVSNVSPQVSNVTLNGGSDINLSVGGEGPNGSTTVLATAQLVDHNGCSDIATVTVKAYPTGVGAAGCTSENNNTCYYNISCATSTCQGNGYTANATCTISFKYHSDPTDSGTIRAAETWKDTITAEDEALSTSTELTTGVETISYLSLDVTSQIQYGTLSAGEITDSTALPVTATTTATGNTGLDIELSGNKMCTDYPGCAGNSIPTSSQRFATSAVQYQNATSLPNTGVKELELNCQKTTVTASPQQKANYWGLQIPLAQAVGSYTGENTYTAVKAETGDW